MKKFLWLFALMALLAACSASDSTSGNGDQFREIIGKDAEYDGAERKQALGPF